MTRWYRCGWLACVLAVPLLSGCLNRTERVFQRAEMFLSQGQMELAAAEYHRLATRYPRSSYAPNALYKLAYLHREEFNSPEKAIATYRLLAERYSTSPYADEAWLWILQIQGETLKDLGGMRATRDIILERHGDEPRVCANAQLQFARCLLAAGQLKPAEIEARAVTRSYPDQERQCAAAMLIIARVMEKRGGKQSDQAVRAYEQIVSKYPQSPSAVEAKRAIGWIYYGQHGQQVKAEQLAKVKAARMLPHVTGPRAVGSVRLKPFGALSGLLAAEGIRATPEELLVVSGAAFDFAFSADQPGAGRLRLPRNALIDAAEEYGFSVNISAVPSAEASFSSLMAVIAAGHPVMVPVTGSGDWWIVSGYKPAEDRVYVLGPGEQNPRAVGHSQFMARWAADARGHTSCVTGPHFQLSLGSRSQAPAASAVIAATARRAVANRNGVAMSYEALANCLGSQGGDPEQAQRLREWAQRRLTEILAERAAIAGFLEGAAGSAPGEREALSAASQGYQDVARLGGQLREVILALTATAQGAEPPAEQTWPEAAELARQMQNAEERALQQLAAVAR